MYNEYVCLLVAADMYQVDDLKAACQQTLISMIGVDNACYLSRLASMYKCQTLAYFANRYIRDNREAVSQTDDWRGYIVMCGHPPNTDGIDAVDAENEQADEAEEAADNGDEEPMPGPSVAAQPTAGKKRKAP